MDFPRNSLEKLCQSLPILKGNNSFPKSPLNLPCFSLDPSPQFLTNQLQAQEHNTKLGWKRENSTRDFCISGDFGRS